MVSPAIFSSECEHWGTPDAPWQELHAEFDFGLDAAASDENAKLPFYITKEQDALTQDWAALSGGRFVWINPPFRRYERACAKVCRKKKCRRPAFKGGPKRGCILQALPGTGAFVAKAAAESQRVGVVMELPARTDSEWWFEHIWDAERRAFRPGVEVRFHRDRRRYAGADNGAPFPSMNVIFYPPHDPRYAGRT